MFFLWFECKLENNSSKYKLNAFNNYLCRVLQEKILNSVKTLITRYTLYDLYIVLFFFLCYGVWFTSGVTYLPYLALFFVSLSVSYFVGVSFFSGKKIPIDTTERLKKIKERLNPNYLIVLSILLPLLHLLYLGYIPTFKAMSLLDGDEVSLVRANISTDSGTLFNYLSSFTIHAILPFTLLYLYLTKRKKILFFVTLIAVFYAFSLMQKSYILTMFLPVLTYAFFAKRYKLLAVYVLVVLGTIVSLTYVANPELNPIHEEEIAMKQKGENIIKPPSNSFIRILQGLERRVMITPGKVVVLWFENIPENLPYAGINGYKFVTRFTGKKHVDYGKALYPIVYPEDARLKGTVNAANFMYEYAYFGVKGLLLSGFILGLIIAFVESLFGADFELKIALNFYSILILSSSSLTTLLFSGGWGLMIFLYLLFLKGDENITNKRIKTT